MAQKIDQYQYWFDTGFAEKTNVVLQDPLSDVTIPLAISTSGLDDGLHYLNVRFRSSGHPDGTVKWNSVQTDYFIKTGFTAQGQNVIAGCEYWFDMDFQNRIVRDVDNAKPDTTLIQYIDVSSLSNGLHYQNIRFRDAIGNWCSVQTDYFIKNGFSSQGQNTIAGYEYWFDMDFQNRITRDVDNAKPDTTLIQYLDVSTLSNGLHYQNIRFRDAGGSWCTVQTDYFVKSEVTAEDLNQIVSYEYWFDDDEAQKVVTDLAIPQLNATVVFEANVNQLSHGQHALNTRFYNTKGASALQTDYFIVGAAGIDGLSTSSVMIYPNPTSEFVNISISKPAFISIVDMQSKIVWASVQELEQLKMDISFLDAGAYHVVFKSGNSILTSKLLVQ